MPSAEAWRRDAKGQIRRIRGGYRDGASQPGRYSAYGIVLRHCPDSGEKILVTHEPGERRTSSGARLTIDRLKLMGFSSETVIRIDLDATAGKAVLAALTNNGASASLESPLGALVAYVHGCASVTEEVARCRALLQSARGDR